MYIPPERDLWRAAEIAPPSVGLYGGAVADDGAPLFPYVELSFPAGRWTCVLGRSGAGKSSLLRAIAGLMGPDGFLGEAAAGDGAPLAGRIGWMAQDPLIAPWMTAREAAGFGARLRDEPFNEVEIDAALAACGLAGLERRRPDELSGGQRQRVALARLLVENRPIALLDEPLAALDAITSAEMIALLWERLAGRTVIHVTHDPLEAARLAHQAVIISETGAQTTTLAGAPLRRWDAADTLDAARMLQSALEQAA